ncbi:MAG: pyridine nucleotide-disulfide oxidoreductase [Betaproteobacteria bacterium RIFCSPLOWO2_02_FULL_65_24]|nr:MAG: pyridine nucleotide-disulfide oxidoreductase [Betaproteobacteria bacterium RIFCSPLOWO2_02_FULL_65_24]OGA73153.1 MAG: pyridine nucleotide-disulfide oxidoreductase [Betaproteobacteria bacterium RIFCSPLOWO2_12_FULL_66_14]
MLGCGFGGLEAAKCLARAPLSITLIDRCNHHLFQPLLYQVATAGLPAPSIAAPIRHIFRKQRNLTVLMGEAQRIDTARRVVLLEDGGEIGYDHLIVATGATHSYFGQDAWAPYAPGLKTLEDAFELRRRILLAFERAERESDVAARRGWLNFTVIGAGATGVEMAGTLAEIARHTLADEFRRIDTRDARIYLIEAGERVLPTYPAELSEKARRQLQRLGVEVRTGNRVIFLDAKGVVVKHKDGEERIASRTAIWAAGVAASPLGRSLEAPLDRAGRVKVEPDLTIPGHPEVSVIGDLAYIENNGTPVPGVSPAAKQMGRRAARNIVARLQGRPARPFRYIDYGILATVGRRAGVAVVGRLKLSGFPAWLMWLFTHIYFLIGFRNRLVVMIDWAWSYFTFQRHARIVIKPGMQQHESEM